ncbi:MAG: hypothetical protein JSS67_10515 [Bacteroidetes bacterium]|nr:hypothetical protein [Bacteroidota bacterium]
MEIHYQENIPDHFPDNSRVWIYQSNRPLSISEEKEINNLLTGFVAGWNTHGNEVNGFGRVFFKHFIVLIADETKFGISGCSTDSSVRMIRQIENKFDLDLLDRLKIALLIENEVIVKTYPSVKKDWEEKNLPDHVLYFNNLILDKKEFCRNWLLPLQQGWLGKKLLPLQQSL